MGCISSPEILDCNKSRLITKNFVFCQEKIHSAVAKCRGLGHKILRGLTFRFFFFLKNEKGVFFSLFVCLLSEMAVLTLVMLTAG